MKPDPGTGSERAVWALTAGTLALAPSARGTAASANAGLFYLGASLGPTLAGLMVGGAGAWAIGWVGLAAALAGLVLVTLPRFGLGAASRSTVESSSLAPGAVQRPPSA